MRKIITGDCLDVMATLDDNSVDAIVTDPPYGLGFMGKDWDHGVPGVAYWRQALRVLKPGGHMLAFGGSRTYHRLACAIEDAGFEVRDQIMWIYGSGFPKSKNLDGDRTGWGTAFKPAHEPICVARKPLQGTVAANVLKWGTGALNIDGCRVGAESTRRQNTAEMGYHGGNLAAEYQTGSDAGRWPANVIHDGSEEVLAGFPAQAGQQASIKGTEASVPAKGEVVYGFRNRVPFAGHGDAGSAARFFYCARASKKDRGEGNSHPTVKPTDLMRYLCRLVTPPKGLILDPFCGSGSTGKAAVLEGFRFIGTELSDDYAIIARARIAAAARAIAPKAEKRVVRKAMVSGTARHAVQLSMF